MDKSVSIITIINNFMDWLVSIADWIEFHSDLVTATATITIAGFTLTLWYATRKLWKISQEQSNDMKISLNIAKISADAAKKSADAFQAIKRARLFIKVKRDPPPKPGELIEGMKEGYNRILINMVNEGESIAIITKINWYIGVMNDKEAANQISELESIVSEFPPGVITIRPNDSADIPVMVEITKYDLKKIDYSTTYFVCLGYIKYKDVFRQVWTETFYWKDNGVFFFSYEIPKGNHQA